MDKRNMIIITLVVSLLSVIYLLQMATSHVSEQSTTYKGLADTLHKYKLKDSTNGAYITTIQGSNKELQRALATKAATNVQYKELIDSLKKDKNIQTAAIVDTKGSIRYVHDVDTIYKNVNIDDSVSTKWYDAKVSLHHSKLGVNVNTRDELVYKNTFKDNKGWFTGKTLTTSFTSKNPDNQITGITSVSTVVEKRKPRLGVFIGPGVLIDKDLNLKAGITAGVGITF